MVTGLQVIAQPRDASEVKILYTNQSIDLQYPVTISLQRYGEYQVSIFAVREGRGILGSTMVYTEQVMVSVASQNTSTSPGKLIYISLVTGSIIDYCSLRKFRQN
jgi:hypothetical protein